MINDCYGAMSAHLVKFFKDDEIFVFEEIQSPDFHLDLYVITPGEGREFYTLVTSGVSSMPMQVPDPSLNPHIELCMFLPKDWPVTGPELQKEEYFWPIELIKDLGRYPHANRTWLGLGHTIPEGKNSYPGQRGYAATMLIKPKMVEDDFLSVPFADGCIDLLMPLIITEAEYAYKKERGAQAFAELYKGSAESDVIDLGRKSFV